MCIHGFTPLTHGGGPTYNKLCANFLHVESVTQTALSKNKGDEKTGLPHETCTPLQYQGLIRVTKNLFLSIDTDFHNDQMVFSLLKLISYLF